MLINLGVGEKRMKSVLVLAVLLFTVSALTGCNTVEGMGRDIEKAGQSIQKM